MQQLECVHVCLRVCACVFGSMFVHLHVCTSVNLCVYQPHHCWLGMQGMLWPHPLVLLTQPIQRDVDGE